MHQRLVLLGPPAAGKGTQAELLKDRFGFQVPSVGAMLREQKALGTPAGLRAAEYFERGLLVPDEVSIQVVRDWLAARHGAWAIDGYPRTVGQADAFEAMLRAQNQTIDLALLIEADEPTIRDRVAHRLICQTCGRAFRAGLQVPDASSPCPRCGGLLARRADDSLAALTDRLAEYRAKTAPVISWYQSRNLLQTIDGARDVQSVFADIATALQPAKISQPL